MKSYTELLEAEKYKEIITLANQNIDTLEAKYYKVLALIEIGRYKQAKTIVDQAKTHFTEASTDLILKIRIQEVKVLLLLSEIETVKLLIDEVIRDVPPGTVDHGIILFEKSSLERINGNIDGSSVINEEIITIGKKLEDAYVLSLGLHAQVVIYYRKGDYEKGMDLCKQIIEMKDRIKNRQMIGTAYRTYATGYSRIGKPEEALKYLQSALDIIEDLGGVILRSHIYGTLGMIYWTKGDLDKAFDYYQKSARILKQYGDSFALVITIHNIGKIHNDRGELDVAMDHFKRGLEMLISLGIKNDFQKASAYAEIGTVLSKQGEFDEALKNFNQALEYYEEIGNKLYISALLGHAGETYRKMGQADLALAYFKRSLDLHQNDKDTIWVAYALKHICIMLIERSVMGEELEGYMRQFADIAEQTTKTKVANSWHYTKLRYDKSRHDIAGRPQIITRYKELIERDQIEIDIVIPSLIQLIELLILEYRHNNEQKVLDDLLNYTNQLHSIALQQHLLITEINVLFLKAKLEVLQSNLGMAKHLYNEALELIDKRDLKGHFDFLESDVSVISDNDSSAQTPDREEILSNIKLLEIVNITSNLDDQLEQNW